MTDELLLQIEQLNERLEAARSPVVVERITGALDDLWSTARDLEQINRIGAHMESNFNIDEILAGMDENQTRDFVERMRESTLSNAQEAMRGRPATEQDKLDEQERAELDALRARARGKEFLESKRVIVEKYSRLRTSLPNEADTELDSAGSSRELEQLYRKRLKQIRRGDIRGFSELQAQFRKRGLKI